VDVDGDGILDPGYVKVWLRVWDDGDNDGVFGSDGDNMNEAWSFVKVEDKLEPQITCPSDITIECSDDYTDLDIVGKGTGFGSCGIAEVEYNDIIVNLSDCGDGFVIRRWSIVGRTDIFCDQNITIDPIESTPVTVSFAQVGDFTAEGCPDDIAIGEPTWTGSPCDLIAYSVETDTFLFEDGACYKLVNEYTVINWCTYEPNNPDTDGIWKHTQVVKVTDNTLPDLQNCEDQMYEVNDHDDSDEEAHISLLNTATDIGSENCPTGWLKWQVIIDLWGDGTDDYEYNSFLPPFDSQFNDTNGNGIPDVYIAPTASGEQISVPLPDIEGSMSNHKVTWKVSDGCNNVTSCTTNFMVVDKKAPTPYCIDISSAVMEGDGTVELWAIDFNVGSFDNCTQDADLRYTFTDVEPDQDPDYDEEQRSSSKLFDCDDVLNSPITVNMYVWDENGNSDFCTGSLSLVDNGGSCGDGMRIAGLILTEGGLPVNDVQTRLLANLPEYPRFDLTEDDGIYEYYGTPINSDFTVVASKDIDYTNGVSTLDLVKIQRHILGLEDLDSPYKLIAADVNADDDLKASDLLELRKLILGVIIDLPTNESWRFVNAEQELDMELDLSTVNYTIDIENLQEDLIDQNIVAVKVGDVTGNATANLVSKENVEVRSSNTLEFLIDEKSVNKGDIVEVDFNANEFKDVFGFQFTFELNGLKFEDATSSAIEFSPANVGLLSDRVVTVSYHSGIAKTVAETESVFTVVFTAMEDGQLSEMIEVTSKVTAAEAYLGDELEIRNVSIVIRGDVQSIAENNLYQNEPNPFKDETLIKYELARSGPVVFTVTDVAGKTLYTVTREGRKGMNTLILDAEALGVTGVLYYTIENKEFTATKKMIIVR
jgi:hypothetical protein